MWLREKYSVKICYFPQPCKCSIHALGRANCDPAFVRVCRLKNFEMETKIRNIFPSRTRARREEFWDTYWLRRHDLVLTIDVKYIWRQWPWLTDPMISAKLTSSQWCQFIWRHQVSVTCFWLISRTCGFQKCSQTICHFPSWGFHVIP